MKKKAILVFIITFLSTQILISASSGWIKEKSIVNCNGKNYGQHGDGHYHLLDKDKNGRWIAVGDPLPSFNGCDSLDDKVESESAAENNTPSESVDNTQVVEKEEPNEELGSGTDEPTSKEMKLVYFNTAINGIDYVSPDGNGVYNLTSGLKIEDILGVLVDDFYYGADSTSQQGDQYVFKSHETEFIADIVVEKQTNGIVALVIEYKMIVGLAAFIIALLGIAKILLNR